MPIHMPTMSRRGFLAGSLATVGGVLSVRDLVAAGADVDPNRFALLADTHVARDAEEAARGVKMAAHCRRAVADVLEMEPRPAGVIINGDAAYLRGLPGDYRQLERCLRPLAEADVPVHVTMGNHDDRGPFYAEFAGQRPEHPPLETGHVGVVETEHANWFLVDSLNEVNDTPGRLGEQQLEWLAGALDERGDKPALLCGHHYPEWGDPGNGLRDTEALFDVLKQHPHVKAYIFGHSHRWDIDEHAGVRLINLPAVAYVFQDSETSGYVDARLQADGLQLSFRALDAAHAYHGETVDVPF